MQRGSHGSGAGVGAEGSGTERAPQGSRKRSRPVEDELIPGSARKREHRDAPAGTRRTETEVHLESAQANASAAGSVEQALRAQLELARKDAELARKDAELREARKDAELREARKDAELARKDAELLQEKMARKEAELHASRTQLSFKDQVLGTTTDGKSLWKKVTERLSKSEFRVPTLDSFEPYEVGDNNIHKGKVARAGLKKHPNTGLPYLLMHDLDTSLIGNEVLKNLAPAPSIPMCLLGVSGTGKTRALYELLSRRKGFIFSGMKATNPNAGAGDVGYILQLIDNRLKEIDLHEKGSQPLGLEEQRRLEFQVAEHLFRCLVVGRQAVYFHIAKSNLYGPLNWLIGQLHPRLLVHEGDPFQDVVQLLVEEGPKAVRALGNLLRNQMSLPSFAALDECQELMTKIEFTAVRVGVGEEVPNVGQTNSASYEKCRTRFAVAMHVMSGYFSDIIASGTGVSMTRFGLEVGSHLTKEQKAKVTLDKLDRNKVKDYLNKFLILKESSREEDLSFDKIVGRARFAARVVQHALGSKGGSVADAVQEFETTTTTKEAETDVARWEYNTLYGAMHRLETEERFHKVAVDGKPVNLYIEFKRIAIDYMLTALPQIAPHLDLIEVGVCFVHKHGDTKYGASLCEPLVLKAAINRFNLLETYEDALLASQNLPSAMGLQWERVVLLELRSCFRSLPDGLENHPLLEGVELPEQFKGACSEPAQYVFLGNQSIGSLSLVTWLKECVDAIEQKEPLPSMFFLPENAAGPDLVFWLVVGENKHILVFLQAKLARHVNIKEAYETVIPERCYKCHANQKNMLSDLVRKRAEVQGVCRMVVIYPAPVKNLETSYPAPGDQDSTDDLLIVVKESNADKLFSPKHLELLRDLKIQRM